MSRLLCAGCEQPLQDHDDLADCRIYCPRCQHVHPVPAATAVPAGQASAPPEQATLPPLPAPVETATLPPLAAFTNAPPATLPPRGDGPAGAAPDVATATVPGYEILAELGRGGMGVVYRARQVQLGRVVALKMILAGGHAAGADLARFQAEAEAVARLQHPHIVQIHEVGAHAGLPFFSLEFCPGGSLEKKLAGTPLPPKEAAALMEKLARAMHAVHQKGVVHRDLKPANVLLAEDGTPKVTDFGLAKRLGEAGQTQSGAVVGTPSYMAPEQAEGKGKEIGPAADVYALGAILYECLTGRPPFKAATPLDTILQVVTAEPVPPTRLQPRLPRDLETICLKCLQKEPRKRYATAEALAEDLRRFGAGEPIVARPVGMAERTVKWVRRRPAVAALLAVAVLATLVGVGGITWSYLEAEAQRALAEGRRQEAEFQKTVADQQKTLAEKQQKEAERQTGETKIALGRALKAEEAERKRATEAEWLVYAGKLSLAQREWELNNVAVARDLLASSRPEFRGWEYHYLDTLFNHHNQRTFRGHSGYVMGVAFSPDGQRLAGAIGSGRDKQGKPLPGEVRVWNAHTGQEILTLRGHAGAVTSVAFSPDGTRLASASFDQTVKLWDARSGQELLTLRGHVGPVESLAFSPDGQRLASASWDQTVKIWDAHTGQHTFTLRGHTATVSSVAFSPDGKRLAGAIEGGRDKQAKPRPKEVKVWDSQSGQEILALRGASGPVAFSPDGQRLASGNGNNLVKVWDAQIGQEFITLGGHTGSVTSVVFSPDGKRLASASGVLGLPGELKVWDTQTAQEILTLRGHTEGITGVAFSPDGKRLASASGEPIVNRPGEVKVWDAHTGQAALSLRGAFGSVAFSPDGQHLASASVMTVKVWEAQTGKITLTLPGHTAIVTSVVFSPDGQRLASASEDKTVKVWDAKTGKELLGLRGHSNQVTSVAFSPDGQRLASASADQTVKVWDAHTGQEILTLRGGKIKVIYSPDGQRLASASAGGRDKQGEALPGEVKVWDAQTGQEVHTLRGHTNYVNSVAFSPDGQRLATASADKTLKIWDAQTGQDLLTLRGHTKEVKSVAFSPDGQRLASASVGEVKVWDASGR
jgi:WD40 repeat protein